MSFDDKLNTNDLNSVSAGRRSNDCSYNISKEQALATAKSLGGELGVAFLNEYSRFQIEKVTKQCKELKDSFGKWDSEEK